MQENHSRSASEKREKIWPAKRTLLFLEQMQRLGAELYLDGEAVGSSAAVIKAVQEDSVYMADYVLGEAGNVEQVRFDRVEPGETM